MQTHRYLQFSGSLINEQISTTFWSNRPKLRLKQDHFRSQFQSKAVVFCLNAVALYFIIEKPKWPDSIRKWFKINQNQPIEDIENCNFWTNCQKLCQYKTLLPTLLVVSRCIAQELRLELLSFILRLFQNQLQTLLFVRERTNIDGERLWISECSCIFTYDFS